MADPADRVTAIYKPSDFPADRSEEDRQALTALFSALKPGVADPAIDNAHAGVAIAAQNPALALKLAQLSGFIALQMGWSARRDLCELAIQAVNTHFGSTYSFQCRVRAAEAAGISVELQNSLPRWRAVSGFSDEQRLVIEYAEAVASGSVPDELFARAKAAFGEQGVVECTSVIGMWSFWAMFLNATAPDLRFAP